MYIKPTRTYYEYDGTQHAGRALFLLLLQPKQATIGETCSADNTYAVVRKVALRQLGHWMMGRVNLGGTWYSVSGAYGSDGLPMNVAKLPADAKPLPHDLYQAWSKGGGWNNAGNEAPAMRDWALANLI